ncbi:MAG: N-acetylglucosaminidase, partial [Bacilli bacterium]
SSVTGKVVLNEPLNVEKRYGSWVFVSSGALRGWAAEAYITYGNAPTNPPVVNGDRFGNVYGAATLNVRQSDSATSSNVGTLNLGEGVRILSESTNSLGEKWFRVSTPQLTGWVMASYIQESFVSISAPLRMGYVDSKDGLNVRQEPNASSTVLGMLKDNDEFEVTGETNDFYQIDYNGSPAYVAKSYTKFVHAPTFMATNYDSGMDAYIKSQSNTSSSSDANYQKFAQYIDPARVTNKMQFLRIDQFREVNVSGLNSMLEGQGVLSKRGQAFVDAARKYNIDPLYFISQSIHETGWGKSAFANGITISEIAKVDANGKYIEIRNSKNELIGYEMEKLPAPVTVYNLYGIGAYDNLSTFPNRARVAGTSYAYRAGWNSIPKAIDGAAKFVNDGYIHSTKYYQNTIYKMRWNPLKTYKWHQYATTNYYANDIGKLMTQFVGLYQNPTNLIYDIPAFNLSTRGQVMRVNETEAQAEEVPKLTLETTESIEHGGSLEDAVEDFNTLIEE